MTHRGVAAAPTENIVGAFLPTGESPLQFYKAVLVEGVEDGRTVYQVPPMSLLRLRKWCGAECDAPLRGIVTQGRWNMLEWTEARAINDEAWEAAGNGRGEAEAALAASASGARRVVIERVEFGRPLRVSSGGAGAAEAAANAA